MTYLQNEQLGRAVLADRRRDAARWYRAPSRPGRVRSSTGTLLVGLGRRLEEVGGRLQQPPADVTPCVEPG